jgi:hypothetical protein
MNKLITLVTFITLVFVGCDNTYDEPAEWTPENMTPNMTIAQLKALYKGSPTTVNAPDSVVAGKVISTDKYGNFYRTFYIQDETGGIEIKIGKTTLYNTYKIGQVVYVKPHHLCLGTYGGMVNVGMPSNNPKYENAWIDAQMLINRSIFRGTMEAPVEPVEITSAADITEARIGTWVRIKNATYQSGSPATLTTWAIKDDPGTVEDESDEGEHRFTLSGGGEVTVRTSGYAKFADTPIPFPVNAKVNLTGVLTRFNTTIQLILNTDKDVEVVK